MTWIFLLKFIHVIGAAVLLGTGAGIAFSCCSPMAAAMPG